MERLTSIEALRELRQRLSSELFREDRQRAKVCCGTACIASGSIKVINEMEKEADKRGLDIEIIKTGCQGMCQKGPNIKVEPYNIYYQRIKPEQASSLISYTFIGGTPYREGLYRKNFLEEPILEMSDLPFYKKQFRIALRNNDKIDPTNIDHYIAIGGYAALEKALSSMTPDDVLHEVDRANLRGRGGAGFPAGKKWHHTKSAKGNLKFVIANGDEGDPGAFMDRAIMEGDPHSLFEGMLLCAYAIGAGHGLIYVRHEYPLAVKHLRHAIKQAEDKGLMGDNILGSGFSFHLDVREGAGAFVCGESTALVASIEGERGFPRPRPPRLSEQGGGVWGYPSNLNNIETYVCVPPIIEKGADWFRSIGTETSPGTKVFALTGKVKNTGLVEVPMGITLKEIIFDIGGGIMGDKKFKAVQTGGPSGGCIPAKLLDLPVDFDSLTKAGSMMGSGGMVVMDEETCMVDVSKYFLTFSQSESCGKCPPCRVGTYQMLQILDRITKGKGEHGDIEKLLELGRSIKKGSLCGLGQSAPNPVLSTIRYFREEYEEHIYDKHCRANVCTTGMGVFIINQDECFKCGLCEQACAFDAVKVTRDSYLIDRSYCTQCKACFLACPIGAVKIRRHSHVKLEEMFNLPAESLDLPEDGSKMNLKAVVDSRPSKVISCKTTDTLAAVAAMMDENNAGTALVYDAKRRLAGIISGTDISDCTAKGIQMKNERAGYLMTRNPLTLSALTDASMALNVMTEMKLRHILVTEDEKITGMISYKDLESCLAPEMTCPAKDN